MLTKIASLRPKSYGLAYIALTLIYGVVFYLFSSCLGLTNSLIDSLYLSIVTITTLGFGDITPSTSIGKLVVSSEAFAGVVTLGLFLNSISHERSEELVIIEKEIERARKEELRKSLEMHSCLLLDVFKSANPFAWDKHAKYSAPMDDLESFCKETYSNIRSKNNLINPLRVKMLLETAHQNYDTLVGLIPVAAEISSEHLLEWSSLLSNVRNLKQQYERALKKLHTDTELENPWPPTSNIAIQVQELIQASLFLSNRPKIPSE